MRGDCKTPGGKLVIVDVAATGEVITSVRLNGDFFINPEAAAIDVLGRLSSSLVGLTVATPLEEITKRLHAALPWEVELVGTSPQAIAVAVRRALGDANAQLAVVPPEQQAALLTAEALEKRLTVWKSQPWRILPELPLDPALNVALDEVLTQGVSLSKQPTLRFWRWSAPAVILGRCQSILNEIDREAAAALGVKIVRRMTGGGTMFLQPHGAITYSLYLPEALLAAVSLRQSYQVCDAWVVDALRRLGVDAHYAPLNDIACSMGKIGGAAQARRGGVVLHHTTLAYDMDPGEMARVLRIGREKLSDKPAVASAAKRVSPLVRQTGLTREAIVQALLSGFLDRFGGALASLTAEEFRAAAALVESKYGQPAWTDEIV